MCSQQKLTQISGEDVKAASSYLPNDMNISIYIFIYTLTNRLTFFRARFVHFWALGNRFFGRRQFDKWLEKCFLERPQKTFKLHFIKFLVISWVELVVFTKF